MVLGRESSLHSRTISEEGTARRLKQILLGSLRVPGETTGSTTSSGEILRLTVPSLDLLQSDASGNFAFTQVEDPAL
jgi:hypothetical protein